MYFKIEETCRFNDVFPDTQMSRWNLRHTYGWFRTVHQSNVPSMTFLVYLPDVPYAVGQLIVDFDYYAGLFVDQMYRGEGLGSALLEKMYEYTGRGVRVTPDTPRALRLFQKYELELGLIIDMTHYEWDNHIPAG